MKPYDKLRNVTKMLIESACQENGFQQKPTVLYKDIANTLEIASVASTATFFKISESTVYLINEDLKDEVNIFEKS